MTDRVLLHSVRAAAGNALARRLERMSAYYGELRPLVGPFNRPIVQITGPEGLLSEAAESLPQGAARPEAIAVRLRRTGVALSWGEPVAVPDADSFISLSSARGASSVELVRIDPSLLTEMQIGSFFHAYWRRRILRHAVIKFGLSWVLTRIPMLLASSASDIAFWTGVRSRATSQEWARFARSSYVVFYYHRIGRGGWPGHEHLDVDVRRFERHLKLLRLIGFSPLSPDELLAFHSDPDATLPPRRYMLTVDDALRDAVLVLQDHGDLRPLVFVNTSGVGGSPPWALGQAVADWEELGSLQAAGGFIASHSRGHQRLPTLDADSLSDELVGSLHEIRGRFPESPELLAYPHGDYDECVRLAAKAAGYRAAFTTEPGRNGAGIDVYSLRRVGLKNWDGYAAVLWKALAGEWLPRRWGQHIRRKRERPALEDTLLGCRGAGAQPKPETAAAFDPELYWSSRLEASYSLGSVGRLGLSEQFNRWMYAVRRRVFKRVLRGRVDPCRARVLDVGSGTGFYIELWHELGVTDVTGCDLTPVAVKHLRERFPETRFVHLDISAPSLELDGPYDAISAMDVLFHIVDDEGYRRALRNLRELLAPNGLVIFTEDLPHEKVKRHRHQASRSLAEVTALLREVGLEIELRRPLFVLTNEPVDSRSALLAWMWSAVRIFARNKTLGWWAGAFLFPLELILTRILRDGPATEILICRSTGDGSG